VAKTAQDVHCPFTLESLPQVFGIVDASPVFINRPPQDRVQFYSVKFKRRCVKVQALVAPDGQCVHFSRVLHGVTHDTVIFDWSRIIRFTTYRDGDRDRQRAIMGI
jgi:hypothetical protein